MVVGGEEVADWEINLLVNRTSRARNSASTALMFLQRLLQCGPGISQSVSDKQCTYAQYTVLEGQERRSIEREREMGRSWHTRDLPSRT